MISKFLVTRFIKNYEEIENEKVRNSYGFLGSTVGIIINTILFIVKLIVGIITSSISVTADAFNNLSDATSSLITMIGFKLASKPADREHPFGHGRIEYISGLAVSFMVMLVGFEFIKSSYSRITNPIQVNFQIIPFILILLSILTKVWISRFNKYIGKKINSSALQASSFDALSDVITSSCVALSLVLSKWTTFPLDGYIGILVSAFIIYSGFSLIKETLNPLLGEAPDEELVDKIINGVLSYRYISGVHDLVIHNYGPNKFMASIHAEVPQDISIVKIHEIIDRAEKELSNELNIILVIHMDPINTNDKEVNFARKELEKIIKNYSVIKSIHDFRIVGEGEKKNLIFDIVIDYNQSLTEEFQTKIVEDLSKDIKKIHPLYDAVITIDRDFT
ncbi:cation diffusion facilitator family transporter [Clostridium tetanomorphum]|uniref:Cation transporter n=1 Tax=Clostridium tetanomorphum TaxID=1553 RepID=A0A923EDC4_CLOTT|nr:cation diffusion facilitator family transporter [Clostridium tetanomorphum]KAJ49044.1 cobalt-zinc-cadmium resistance protein czcD [Clostridium tetanomorphum DSM 665]KAJ51736.1 cobalt-zinc-cadmium resistance protein czcD [Clostridium tetanomorphum DSM 665]MBC2399089.1 cation transporter [Clostridium tetanomorphum]MBP1865898.1 cation diffusion facilitator family transporter [Clostridium tetanomorphum]NRS86079.1 cation diffusion facilitator family transporter [Clostridium tetanomorphum]